MTALVTAGTLTSNVFALLGSKPLLGRGLVPSDELVPVLTPREAKGLEFDHVVVVEPAAIELRELYVALTRPTKTLTVVHARPLPPALGVQDR